GPRGGGGERIRPLIVHVLRRASRPVREDDDLLLANVGNGIDWRLRQCVVAASGNRPHPQDDKERVLQTPAYDGVNHSSVFMFRRLRLRASCGWRCRRRGAPMLMPG